MTAQAPCALDVSQMTAISTPNGDFETGLTTNWTFDHISGGVQGPASGDWQGDFYYELNGAGWAMYAGFSGVTFIAGQTYVVRARMTLTTGELRFGFDAETGIGDVGVNSDLGGAGGWQEHCVEWTPSANRDGADVEVMIAKLGALASFHVDDVRAYTGSAGQRAGAGVGTVVGAGDGTVGPSDDYYMVAGSALEHTYITTGGPYHDHGSGLSGLTDDDHPQYVKDSEFTASGDILRGTGAGTFEAVKHNNAATAAPAVTDDSGDGYSIGSRWLDTTNDKEYVALDVSVGAAVWLDTTGALTVEDEGTPLATAATTLDFVGAGVTATGAGAEKTITIPGGGSGVTVEEDDGTPTLTATKIVFDNATVTDEGSGVARVTNSGDGGSPPSPTVAGSDAATFSTAGGTISTPAETSEGDLLILFAEQGNAFSSITAGWHILGFSGLANVNGVIAVKVAEAGDASGGGSVTATFTGAFNGELIIVAVTGWRNISGYAWRQNSSSATTITTTVIAASTALSSTAEASLVTFAGVGDLALYFGAARLSSGTITPSRGTVIEQRTGDTNASSVAASETLTGGPVTVTMTTSSSAQVAGLLIVSG